MVVPSIAESACFAADLAGKFYFVGSGGGGGGGYGIVLRPNHEITLCSLLGLLNSNVSTYFLKQISSTFRGGYLALNKQYIEQLPIALLTAAQSSSLEQVVEYLLWLTQEFQNHPEAKLTRDNAMLAWWEQVLNGLVYELYFSKELYAADIRLFDLMQEAALPKLSVISESERLPRLRREFERTYDSSHPMRGALFELGSLEMVRIIEGQE